MALDFHLTQFYRLVVDDLILMYDTYEIYKEYKPKGRSIQEYLNILGLVTEVELQELDDIETGKVKEEECKETVTYLAWDYVRSVLLRFVCDDLSQFAYWSTKILVSLENEPFGMPVVRMFFNHLYTNIRHGNVRVLYEGCIPYLTASFVVNFPSIVRSTQKFVHAVIAKLPSPPSSEELESFDKDKISTTPQKAKPIGYSGVSISPKTDRAAQLQRQLSMTGKSGSGKQHANGNSATSIFQRVLQNVAITTLSHPFLVIAVRMVKHQLGAGKTWLYAYLQLMTNEGLPYLYTALRSRLTYNLIPFSMIYFAGVPDSIIYRRIIGQEIFASTEHVISVARQLANQDNSNAALSILNYGLLTAVQIIPGFVSFLGMRGVGWMLFGATIHRKHQLHRRKEIVEACLQRIRRNSQPPSNEQ